MKLHLGCGSDLREGFLNIDINPPKREGFDILAMDLAGLHDPLFRLLEHNTIDYIYTSHFIEHLTDKEADSLFNSCSALLNEGAVMRILVPNYPEIFQAYLDGNKDYFDMVPIYNHLFPWETASLIDHVQYAVHQFGEHKSVWDFDKFEKRLKFFGFSKVVKSDYNRWVDPDCPMRKRYSLCVEATK